MKFNFKLFLFGAFALFMQITTAQEINVSGTVTDAGGLPIAGAGILVIGSKTGTQSDFDGNFSLKAAAGSTLQVSFMGMITQEVKAATSLRVRLQESSSQLETIVVIGYGTSSKKKLTDNIARVTAKDIQQIPVATVQNALVGKLAGVQITQTNGKVEGGISVRVRGAASISAGREPLYVLDGIPLITTNESTNGAPTNPLLTLSPNEIESIDVLKDASSAAIYGARGANGVVIITTKKGKEGKATFSLNLTQGVSEATNKRKWLNSAQYIELFTEASINGTNSPADAEDYFDTLNPDWRTGNIDTDWQDLAFQNGFTSDADFSVSGGDDKTKYFFSGAYNKTVGIVNSNELERITARSNVSRQISDRFNIGMNLNFSRSEIDRVANDNSFVTPLQAVAQSPLAPSRLADGTPFTTPEYPNFLFAVDNSSYTTKIRRVTGKVFGELKLLPGLKVTSDFAYDLLSQSEDKWFGKNTPFMATNGRVEWSTATNETFIYSNYLTYDKTFAGKHAVNAVFGMEYNRFNRRYQDITSIDFPTDNFQTPSGGAEVQTGSGDATDFAFLSQYFGRATYSYDNKYLLKASIRRDGSSRFGVNNRFGIFPAISAGWIVSEESFLKDNKTLSNLKFKASWGQVGNAEIGNFASRQLFGVDPYNLRSGLTFSQPGNPDLQWEISTQVDYGVEFGLFNRINVEADYYRKDTDGLLFSVPLPISSGALTVNQNIGRVLSEGVEFTLNTKNITTDNFSWNTSANLTTNNTIVKSLPNGDRDIVGEFTINRVGENVSSFYLVEYAGVDSANGNALFYRNDGTPDVNGSRATTSFYNQAKRIVAGNPFPTLMVGMTNTVSYKGIDLSFTFQGEWGASIYNSGGIYQSVSGDYFDNQTLDQMNRWRNPGDITLVPEARLYGGNGAGQSTRFLGKSDFVRLRNLTVGYSLKGQTLQSVGMSSVRIYATGVNLLTFTNYQGYDPEARRDDGNRIGEEFYSAPPARTIALGVNLNF